MALGLAVSLRFTNVSLFQASPGAPWASLGFPGLSWRVLWLLGAPWDFLAAAQVIPRGRFRMFWWLPGLPHGEKTGVPSPLSASERPQRKSCFKTLGGIGKHAWNTIQAFLAL